MFLIAPVWSRRAIVCVTMASKVRHGDLRNIVPSERKPNLLGNRR
jgi:hypothetical protein